MVQGNFKSLMFLKLEFESFKTSIDVVRLLLVKLICSVRGPFGGFVYVVDRVICKVAVVADIG